jgi:hypothetical protein
MPLHQRDYVDQSTEYFCAEAKKIGPWALRFVEGVFQKRKYPQLGFRTCQGMLRLAKKYGQARIEAACQKAAAVGGFSYRSLESLLLHNLDQFNRTTAKEQKVLHLNIRGADYYRDTQEETEDAHTSDIGQAESAQADRHA